MPKYKASFLNFATSSWAAIQAPRIQTQRKMDKNNVVQITTPWMDARLGKTVLPPSPLDAALLSPKCRSFTQTQYSIWYELEIKTFWEGELEIIGTEFLFLHTASTVCEHIPHRYLCTATLHVSTEADSTQLYDARRKSVPLQCNLQLPRRWIQHTLLQNRSNSALCKKGSLILPTEKLYCPGAFFKFHLSSIESSWRKQNGRSARSHDR